MERLKSLEQLARSAWNGTSFSPEKRGASFIQEHEAALEEDLKQLPEEHHARYISVFKSLCQKYLASHSNVVSSMIAGPSNFPAARMNKRAGWAHDHYQRLSEFRDRFPKWVKKKERLEKQAEAIAEGKVFTNEIERLTEKLAELENTRKVWKVINTAHAKFLKTGAIDPELPAVTQDLIRNYKPAYSWEPHPIAPYQFRNMSGQVKQVKGRLAELSRKEENRLTAGVQGNRTWQGDGVKVVERMDINRVQIVHDKKPGQEVITRLKKGGWRWSPREKAWQRHASNWALHEAQDITGINIKAPVTSPHKQGTCRVCGCTDNDCRQCIEKTGQPCYWVEENLCSACYEPPKIIDSCCGPAIEPYEAPECSDAVHSPQVTSLFLDTEGNVFDKDKNYMGKGKLLESGIIEITRDFPSPEKTPKFPRHTPDEEAYFDQNDDGNGGIISDADPGL